MTTNESKSSEPNSVTKPAASSSGSLNIGDPEVSKQVARNLRSVRKSRGFTLELLAEQTGMSVSYISRLEAGSRRVNLDILSSVARVLQCEISDILHGNANLPSFQDLGLQYSSSVTGKPLGYIPTPDPSGIRKYKKINEGDVAALKAASKDLPLYGLKLINPGQKITEEAFDFIRPRALITRGMDLVDVRDAFALEVPDNRLMPKFGPGDVLLINPGRTPIYKTPVIIILENDRLISALFQEFVEGGVCVFLFKGAELVVEKIPSAQMKSIYRVVGVTYA